MHFKFLAPLFLFFLQGCAALYEEAYLPRHSAACEAEIKALLCKVLKSSDLKLFSPPFADGSRLFLMTHREREMKSGNHFDSRFATFLLLKRETDGVCFLSKEGATKMFPLQQCHCERVKK